MSVIAHSHARTATNGCASATDVHPILAVGSPRADPSTRNVLLHDRQRRSADHRPQARVPRAPMAGGPATGVSLSRSPSLTMSATRVPAPAKQMRELVSRCPRGPRSGADVGGEVLAGEGGAGSDDVGGGALEDEPRAVMAGAGAEVDDP